MSRVRIMEYGPTVKGMKHTPRITTNVVRQKSRFGVILRRPPKLDLTTTTKSVLRPKVIKGIKSPGQQPYNYPSPLD